MPPVTFRLDNDRARGRLLPLSGRQMPQEKYVTLCRKLATLVAPWLEEELGGLECVNITQCVICFDKYGTRTGNFLPVGLSRFFFRLFWQPWEVF